jgi:hypothetical protein
MRYYELINPTRGYSTQLSAREWEMLRALAVRYGWEPEPGRNYAREGTIGDVDAAAMATAVKQALRDVPIFYAAAKKDLPPAEHVREVAVPSGRRGRRPARLLQRP